MRWIALIVLFVPLAGPGCFLSPQPDPPGWDDVGGSDASDVAARDDKMSEGGADSAPGDVYDGGMDDGAGYDERCPNDPESGRVGGACAEDRDCGDGYACIVEVTAEDGMGGFFTDYAGGYCAPVVPGGGEFATCVVGEEGACDLGARCIPVGPVTAGPAGRCRDACAVADVAGVPYPANCDCREGYRCDLSLEVCVPGCLRDADCCLEWIDGNGDGVRAAEELAAISECIGVCNPFTFRCEYPGDSEAAIGDDCWHDSECPAGATCWALPGSERNGLPGVCLLERCDLAGRDCPVGAACVEGLPLLGLPPFCGRPCRIGAGPGEPGFACGVGTTCVSVVLPDPDDGDGVCLPVEAGH
jgi:hypothetical protein